MKYLGLLRKQHGMSQQQLAEQLGLSTSAIGMYEQGRREPAHETLREMAMFFDVTIDYLLGVEGQPQPRDGATPAFASLPENGAQLADAVLQELMQQNALMFHASDLSEGDYEQLAGAVRQAVDIVLARQTQDDQ